MKPRHLTHPLLLATTLALRAGQPEAGLAQAAKPWGPGDPIAFADGRVIFDLSARARFEARENTFDFNSAADAPTDDSFLLERARIGLTLKPADWFTLRVQGQDAREVGSARADTPGVLGAEGDDPFDLRLLSVGVASPDCPFSIELGRQALNYGEQRLIGAFEWNNIGRVFDAAVLHWKTEGHRLDLFAASVVNVDPDGFNQSWFTGADARQVLSGLYYSTDICPLHATDLYVLWQNAEGGTDFGTLGARWASKPGALAGFDYAAEGVFQLGEVSGQDLLAGALHFAAGHTWDVPWKPRFGLAFDFGTGDGNASDDEVNTFQNLYPTNHLYYGYMDAFSWQNVVNPSVELSAKPLDQLSLRAAWHFFWLADTADAWYRANGVARVRPISPAASAYCGSEIDLTVSWKPAKWAELLVGYSHFFAGDYLADTGPDSDADFLYVQAGVSF